LITQLLSQTPGAAKLVPLGDTPFFRNNRLRVPREVIGVVEGEHVRAWVDQLTGDVAIYPTLDKLQQITPSDVERQTSRASEIFRSPGFIAQDDTRFVVDKPNTLNGATLVRDASGNVSQEKPTASYLAFYAARRFAGNLPVDGPGSRALLELGSQGSVEGLTRVWKSAKTTQMVRPSATAEQVRAAITGQLRPAIANSEVTVDRIELAYYDGNGTYLQPVYRFTAQIHSVDDAANAAANRR
jgi:hypothetical protein